MSRMSVELKKDRRDGHEFGFLIGKESSLYPTSFPKSYLHHILQDGPALIMNLFSIENEEKFIA